MHIVAAAALVAANLAQIDPICVDLQRLSAATASDADYAALYRSDFVPNLLSRCFRNDGYFCSQTMLAREISAEAMAKRIAACLPGATIASGKEWPGLRRIDVSGGGLAFHLQEGGSERAHVGRSLEIQIKRAPS